MTPQLENIPRHIAMIMDGNGRWAAEQGLPRIKGHERGAETVRTCVEVCGELGVKYLTLYAFSTENWKRPQTEVFALMTLLERFLKEKTNELVEKNVRLHTIGRTSQLPVACQRELARTKKETEGCTGLHLVLALSYGSREEIVDAAKRACLAVQSGKLALDDLTPDTFSQFLDTDGIPDPDLLVRTSGELRVSNFLLWQISYTELWVTRKLWPEFAKEDLLEAIREFGQRQRRYGAV